MRVTEQKLPVPDEAPSDPNVVFSKNCLCKCANANGGGAFAGACPSPTTLGVSSGVSWTFYFLHVGASGCVKPHLLEAHGYRRFSLRCVLVLSRAKHLGRINSEVSYQLDHAPVVGQNITRVKQFQTARRGVSQGSER